MGKLNHSQIILGITLIGLGLLFLLTSLGFINWLSWRILLKFWPLILVFIGLNLLLKETKIWWLVPLLVVLLIAVFFITINRDFDPLNNRGHYFYRNYRFRIPTREFKNHFNTYVNSQEMNYEIKKLKVNVSFGAGKLFLTPVDKDKLYEVDMRYKHNKPSIDYEFNEENKEGHLVIVKEKKTDWLNISSLVDDWHLYLAENLPLDMEISTGASQINLELSELSVENLIINSGAGNLTIKLGAYNSFIRLNSGAANIKLYLSAQTGIQIKTTGIISNNNFAEVGLNELYKDTYQSKNYGKAVNNIKIEISVPASNVDLNFY